MPGVVRAGQEVQVAQGGHVGSGPDADRVVLVHEGFGVDRCRGGQTVGMGLRLHVEYALGVSFRSRSPTVEMTSLLPRLARAVGELRDCSV